MTHFITKCSTSRCLSLILLGYIAIEQKCRIIYNYVKSTLSNVVAFEQKKKNETELWTSNVNFQKNQKFNPVQNEFSRW